MTNARTSWYEWGDSWKTVNGLLQKLNIDDKIPMIRNQTAFALDNDGFRYALAAAMLSRDDNSQFNPTESFEKAAETSWRKSHQAMIGMMNKIQKMTPYPTTSILDLNKSYQTVQILYHVRS